MKRKNNSPKIDKSNLLALSLVLDSFQSISLPDRVKKKLSELSDLCFHYIGDGFTYKVITDSDDNIDFEEIEL